ncbi:MAG: ABC transporter permease subunit [Acidimicrobiia bacterium]|nr:ABC transporter permease subunit [Acidimicrobiia bacterium]NNC74737.1 ABC transporter permease subunit [Acidimicrobiia bacterium]
MATYEHEATVVAETAKTPRMNRPSFRRWFRETGWRHLAALLGVAFALFPIAWIITSSINTLDSLTTVKFWPSETTLSNYTQLFQGCSWEFGFPPFSCAESSTPFPVWLFNSIKIALIAASAQLVMSALAAYSFSRLRWAGRRLGLISILLVQMFPQFLAFVAIFLLLDTLETTFPEARQAPIWLVVVPLLVFAIGAYAIGRMRGWESSRMRWLLWFLGGAVAFGALALYVGSDFGVTIFPKIGLNTHTGLIMVYLGGAVGVNTWLIKGFMDSIPTSLDEAARVDGATDWDIFSKIIFPLTQPILIVIFIITFIGLYNEFILAQVLINDVDQFTYATGLNLFIDSQYTAKWGQISAAAVIGATPIVLLFLIMQDRIVSALQGAVKG